MKIIKKLHITTNGIIASLLIGILGSAIYEHLFSPLSNFIFTRINNWMSEISQNSSDRLYKAISLGFNEKFATLAAITSFSSFVLIALLSIWLLQIFPNNTLQNTCRNNNDKPNQKIISQYRSSKIKAIMILIETTFLIISCFYFVGKVQFIHANITKCLNNIEIISPYVSDFEYKKLKSTFYQMNSKDDYDYLISALNEIALQNNIALK